MRAANVFSRRHLHDGVAGFTLIEVLVSVFILAVGLLGIISLQYASKQVGYDSLQRSTAAMLAEGLIERMRANPGDEDEDGVLPAYIPAAGRTFKYSDAIPTPPTCGSSNCTPLDWAEYDLAQWYNELIGSAETVTGSPLVPTGGLVTPWACLFNINAPAGGGQTSADIIVAIAWAGRNELPDVASATGDAAFDDARNCGRGDATDFPLNGTNSLRRVLVMRAFVTQ
jgi:type IV pilus assembly protein PilV